MELADLRTKVKWLQRMLAAVAVMATFAVATGAFATVKACDSRHKIVIAGSEILPTPMELKQYVASGRMTREEYKRALQNIETWHAADCRVVFP